MSEGRGTLLAPREYEWLRTMPAWHDVNGRAIASRIESLEKRLEIALSLMNRDIEGQYEEALGEVGLGAVNARLTSRELQVLVLAADGLTRQEIAERQGVSVETIKSQLKWCRIRLAARNTTHAVARGFQEGLLQ